MEGRRFRRYRRPQSSSLLPLRSTSTHVSNTISCWYCDLKISSLNDPLYNFGQRYARSLRAWFTVGVGFSFSVLIGVTMVLILEAARVMCIYNGTNKLSDLFSSFLFGFSPSVLGFSISLLDVGYLIISTVIAVAVHEFGHAVAAASLALIVASVGTALMGSSEGIRLEYIAIFVAVFFPGALVAFNYEVLQAKPRFAALRIYCAGIWHNAASCAVCGFALLLLPLISSPLYIHGESPMVLDVSSSSPVSNYLAPGDLIILFDGVKIRNSRDWVEVATLADKQTLQSHSEDLKDSLTVDFGRAYCASSSFLEKSGKISLMRNKSVCPDELIAFVAVPCSSTRASIRGSSEDEYRKMRENMYCLNAGDVITLKRCESLGTAIDNTSSCICSEDEACLFPVQAPGVAWVEISYRRLYSHECAKIQKSVADSSEILESGEPCDKTFLFVGDVISMARSLRLTGYQPRYASPRAAYFPYIVEKILMYTFHVSLTLALLNSLPVYFLDGESILGAGFCYITILSPRRRKVLLQACLLGGSILSFVVFLRAFLFSFR